MGNDGLRPGGYEQALRTNEHVMHFVYLLLRDHLPAGIVEGLVSQATQTYDVVEYSNDFLAAYAIELASRLSLRFTPEAALKLAHAAVRTAQARVP
jgi:uncharacterized membrane protein